jgi:hypothetical protein
VNSPPKEFFELLTLLGDAAMKPLTDDHGVFRFLTPQTEPVEAPTVSTPDAGAKGDRDDAAIQPAAAVAVA